MAFQTSAPGTPVQYRDTRPKGQLWWRQIGWRHVVAVALIIYAVFPLVFALSTSLNPGGSISGSSKLFQNIDLANFTKLFAETDFPSWALNSIVICTITALGTLLMGASAAYAFSRFRFRGRHGALTSLLIIQMFPQMLAFVAIFLLLLSLGDVFPLIGLNQVLGLIAIYLGGSLGSNTFLMYGFFNTIPRELDEAAKLDGCTHAQIFWQIILRLVLPILTVVGLLSFVATYGDFIIAKVVMQTNDKFTIAVGLYQWASNPRAVPWSLFAAGAIIAAIPVVILFLFLQKYIVSGLTAGSVKG